MDPHSSNVPARQTFIRLTEDPGRQPWVLILLPAAAVYAGLAAAATFAVAPFSATARRSDLLGSSWPSTIRKRGSTFPVRFVLGLVRDRHDQDGSV
jgi:hypothetical protein